MLCLATKARVEPLGSLERAYSVRRSLPTSAQRTSQGGRM